jgi:hypothetical protein
VAIPIDYERARQRLYLFDGTDVPAPIKLAWNEQVPRVMAA